MRAEQNSNNHIFHYKRLIAPVNKGETTHIMFINLYKTLIFQR